MVTESQHQGDGTMQSWNRSHYRQPDAGQAGAVLGESVPVLDEHARHENDEKAHAAVFDLPPRPMDQPRKDCLDVAECQENPQGDRLHRVWRAKRLRGGSWQQRPGRSQSGSKGAVAESSSKQLPVPSVQILRKESPQGSSEEDRSLAAKERLMVYRSHNPYLEAKTQEKSKSEGHRRAARSYDQLRIPPRFQRLAAQHCSPFHDRIFAQGFESTPLAAQSPGLLQQTVGCMTEIEYSQSIHNVVSKTMPLPSMAEPEVWPPPMGPVYYQFSREAKHWHPVPYMTYWGPCGDPPFYEIPMRFMQFAQDR